MSEQDKTSGQNPATPGPDAKKPAVAGAAVENRAVDSTKAQDGAAAAPKPAVESTLVGQPGATAKPAAAAKPANPVTSAATIAAASAKTPAAAKPDLTKSDAATSQAAKSQAAPPQPATTDAARNVTSPPPAASQPPRQIETRVEVRRGGFMPTFLGGVVAAGLGAAACYWAIPHLPAAWQPGVVDAASAQLEAARQAGIQAAQAEVQSQAQGLGDRAAEAGADAARQILADAPPAAGGAAPEGDKIAALEKAMADLNARLAQQPGAPVAPAAAGGVSQAALDELAARVSRQQAALDELAARPAVDPSTAQQVQELAQQAQELQQSTEAANRRAQAATAVAALQSAIENAAPRDQALADLTAAGVQVPTVLAGDIPRLEQLRAGFPAAARAGLRESMDSIAGQQGAMDKIGNFLRVQTGARSVEPREGDDPDAVLSRANAAVESGDIPGALTQIGTLPDAGQQAMAEWVAQAQVWVDANAALAALVSGQ